MTLFTIGYENAEITNFIEALRRSKIQRVADVRKNPVSRKRGFSKNKLAEHLRSVDIDTRKRFCRNIQTS